MADDALAGRLAMRLGLPGNWRSLGAIILTSTIIGMTLAFSFPLLSLVLDRRGVPADLIGLNSALNGLAVFVVAPWLPRLVNRLGVARSMACGQALGIACFLALPLKVDLVFWSPLRFLLGLGTVIAWVASESAVNALASDASRGRVIGVYATLFCVGYAAGPALVGVIGSEGFLPFALCASLLALGLLPLLLVRGLEQAMAERGSADLLSVWAQAPLALGAILVFGFVETICFALLPIYGLRVGYDEAGATLLLSALIAGNIVFQLPLGWLADHLPRAGVLLGCVAVALLGVLVWPRAMGGALVWPLLVIWGGALGGLYTLSQTLLGARFRGRDLAVANTAFVLLYQAGAMSGPAIGGIALERLGAPGLPLVMAVALAAFLVTPVLGSRRRRAAG